MRIVLSEHAHSRFHERVRPAISHKQARRELEALVAMAGGSTQAQPPWDLETSHKADRYLELSDGICLVLCRNRNVLLAVTCLTRAEKGEAHRAEERAWRRHKRQARKTRHWHEKHSFRGRPPREYVE